MKWEYASRVLAKDGEAKSGDAVFARVDASSALFVLLDALGHGHAAALVAERSMHVLSELPKGADALAAIMALNWKLHGTRGAVATACFFTAAEGQIAGVGNVRCRGLGCRSRFVPTPGVLGTRSQIYTVTRLSITAGQGLLLHSDGISHRFEPQRLFSVTPEAAFDHIITNYRYRHDDASVLIIGAKARLGMQP
jgi:phosphoserine phosphatase RsbX